MLVGVVRMLQLKNRRKKTMPGIAESDVPVSHIWALILFPSMVVVLMEKSTPIVTIKEGSNVSLAHLLRSALFPLPESPIMIAGKSHEKTTNLSMVCQARALIGCSCDGNQMKTTGLRTLPIPGLGGKNARKVAVLLIK